MYKKNDTFPHAFATTDKQRISHEVARLCEGKGTLLYLVQFGSHLYGTNTQHSDTDYKGIFLPDIANLVLEQQCRSITHHTGSDAKKNISGDIDIDLWSLQHWFKLLEKGDTNAIDMLFSYTNSNAIIYASPLCDSIFANPTHYINLRDNASYVAYAYHQAKKYGLKGSRLHLLKSIYFYVNSCLQNGHVSERATFKTLIPSIKERFFDEKLCFDKQDTHGTTILYILGSGFHEKITIADTVKRLEASYLKYGERAILAEKNENIDWKSISHAMRCIVQIKELAQTGHLTFPLKDAAFLKTIKSGKLSWKECEQHIVQGLAELEPLINALPRNTQMNSIHKKTILSCYPQLNGRA